MLITITGQPGEPVNMVGDLLHALLAKDFPEVSLDFGKPGEPITVATGEDVTR